MNRNNLKFAIAPGQYIVDELEARHIDFSDLKSQIPDLTTEKDLVSGVTVITEHLAIQIGKFLEMPAKVWLDLEHNYRDAIEHEKPILTDENVEAAQAKAASGRLLLRLPVSLHRRVTQAASAEGVSLNQLLLSYIAEGIGRTEVKRSLSDG
jgi:plasmid maintenance system antidote protein VapI